METSSLAVQGKANRNQEQELGQNGGFRLGAQGIGHREENFGFRIADLKRHKERWWKTEDRLQRAAGSEQRAEDRGQRKQFRIANLEIVGPVTVPAGKGNSSTKDFVAGAVTRPTA